MGEGRPVRVAAEDPRSGDALALMAALDQEMSGRYPASSIHGYDPAEIAASGMFMIAREDDRALGCGALRPLEPGVMELKRMYVRPEARGRGVARLLLAALERAADDQGASALRLETGTLQPEAIGLYQAADYRRIPCFGEYATDPFSVCYEKRLGR